MLIFGHFTKKALILRGLLQQMNLGNYSSLVSLFVDGQPWRNIWANQVKVRWWRSALVH